MVIALSPREMAEFLPEPLAAELERDFPDHERWDPDAAGDQAWPGCLAARKPEVLVTCWRTPPLPDVLPATLRYVCHLGGSTRALITRRHLEHGLIVTNWGDSISRTVAEGALALILGALRRTGQWALRLHGEKKWRSDGDRVESLFERRVGLHGFGFVARELVRLLRPFGNPVSVVAPEDQAPLLRAHGVHAAPSLEALFADNDIVVELAPLTAATRGSVTERHLSLMAPGALFVNLARGPIVDEAGLLRVAREGRLLIALDVFHQEPLPADSPLRGLPNVTLSPHVAGPTNDRRRDAGAFALRNLRAYRDGRPVEAVVTQEVYDHAT